MQASLGALSKYHVGIELDSCVALGSVTLARVKSGGVTAIWIGDRYVMTDVYEYDRKQFRRLVYVALSRVICNARV